MKRPLYGLYGAQICQHTLNCTAKRVAACPCDVTHLEHAVSQEAVASMNSYSHGPILRTFLGVSTSPVV